ncbi:hypothetical protein K474DRAFT_578543 [Panus rudis PR-1116 ss-1]|nr:hypothetical protein K474DRAFT_578543 [Panus rudis PR-1116 ss-1]
MLWSAFTRLMIAPRATIRGDMHASVLLSLLDSKTAFRLVASTKEADCLICCPTSVSWPTPGVADSRTGTR